MFFIIRWFTKKYIYNCINIGLLHSPKNTHTSSKELHFLYIYIFFCFPLWTLYTAVIGNWVLEKNRCYFPNFCKGVSLELLPIKISGITTSVVPWASLVLRSSLLFGERSLTTRNEFTQQTRSH